MKTMNLLTIAFLAISLTATSTFAASTKSSAKQINANEDIDTLGGNRELMEMAEKVKSTSRSRIVQERIVDRRNTLEFGLSYGSVFGGDAYVKTQALGAQVDYHITPRWSLGVRYYDFGNSLTSEGQRIYDDAKAAEQAGGRALPVDIDYPLNSTIAVVNWYPVYGKTSFYDMGVTQFDLYLLAGGGSITLSSGSTSVMTGGLGLGAWITKHVSARAEIRYQTYEDQIATGARKLDVVTGSLGLGWIL
ncbi:outer membrane beta-barrel domain-containing protein [Bdellovibrio bacteriovorus]|uniref:Outer membrane beta-barrel domain-containing protein n=1 Tax=Bdellovibrio bacteriovorus TaxID=959 RepID=A0A150WBU9_BDEBC|nr:outer membrane beta-barrel domain-containing protein [Bdellovibrio bacteriovorus]KYG60439.1 outer membrane beta-barrel domain-containing protein [Bdellovibrio bacteriovorus]